MSKYNRILFLDEDGSRLSAYAMMLLNWKLSEKKIEDLQVEARGNIVLFPEPANQKIAEIARIKGLSLKDFSSQELKNEDFSDTTLVLAVDTVSKQRAYDKYKEAVNVYTIREFVGETGADIKLKLGGSIEDYDAVCSIVDRVTDQLIDTIGYSEEERKEK